MDVARGAPRVGQVLLGHEHERALRHPAAPHLALGGGDLLEGPSHVDGAGAAAGLVGPGHAVLHGQVELERARARAGSAGRRAPRAPAGGRRPDPPRRSGARSSTTASASGSSESERTRTPVSIAAPCSRSTRDQRVGDRLRAAARRRPIRTGARRRSAPSRPRRSSAASKGLIACAAIPREQGARLRSPPAPAPPCWPAAPPRSRTAPAAAGAAGRGAPGRSRSSASAVERRPTGRRKRGARRGRRRRARAAVASIERSITPARAVVERMRAVDLGPAPLEPVAIQAERTKERRAHRHRMDGRADVVDQPGQGQLGAARAAAERVRRPRAPSRPRPPARAPPRRPARSGPSPTTIASLMRPRAAGRRRRASPRPGSRRTPPATVRA